MKEVIDIEELLMSKSWEELNDDERSYILTQVDSGEEYEELRNTLMLISDDSLDEAPIKPDPRIRKELLANFESESPDRVIWLNTLWTWLFPAEKLVWQRPGLQLATLAVVCITIVSIWTSVDTAGIQDNQVAEEKSTGDVEGRKEPESGKSDQSLETVKSEEEGDQVRLKDEKGSVDSRSQLQEQDGELSKTLEEEVILEAEQNEIPPAEGYSFDLDDRSSGFGEAEIADESSIDGVIAEDQGGEIENKNVEGVESSGTTSLAFSKEAYSTTVIDSETATATERNARSESFDKSNDATTAQPRRDNALEDIVTGGAVSASGNVRTASRKVADDDELLNVLFTAY